MFSARSLLLLWVLLGEFPLVSLAQESAGGPPGYAEAINQALMELEANNFPEAHEEFRRAHAIFPNARTLRGLGMVEFELRHYPESARRLEEALASQVKPLEGKLRIDTEKLLERARRYLGEIAVQLQPSNAVLSVDGLKVQLERGVLKLEVGEHTLEARAPGRASERRVVRVIGGARVDVAMSLATLEEPAAQPALETGDQTFATNQPRSEAQPAYKKWWVWTIVAVVAAGGATTAALLLTRDRETNTTPVEGTNTPKVSLQALESF